MASWEERHDDARAHMLPFLERVAGLSGRRVRELARVTAAAGTEPSFVGLRAASRD
jgi:hypothetical protein